MQIMKIPHHLYRKCLIIILAVFSHKKSVVWKSKDYILVSKNKTVDQSPFYVPMLTKP